MTEEVATKRGLRGPPYLLCLLVLLFAAVTLALAGDDGKAWTAWVGLLVLAGVRALFEDPPQ